MVTPQGLAKVLDFGLARRFAPDPLVAAKSSDFTLEGTVPGTLAYMSPEQLRGGELDHRTDLFSFGVTLYEMATGILPYTGETPAAVVNEILNSTHVSPLRLNDALAPGFDHVIGKALEKEPDLRYQSASEITADLKRILRDSRIHGGSSSAKVETEDARTLPQRRQGFHFGKEKREETFSTIKFRLDVTSDA